MDVFFLSETHAVVLIEEAIKAAPQECCGLLIGTGNMLQQVMPVTNIANEPEKRFLMKPQELAQLLPELYANGYDLLGFYHSHPQGYAIPSQTDIEENVYQKTIHLIIGLNKADPEIGAWKIDRGQVFPMKLFIGDMPLSTKATLQSVNVSIGIILISVIFAFLILGIVLIILLPPAPPIP